MANTHRENIAYLARIMYIKKKPHKEVINILEKIYKELPSNIIPYNPSAIGLANLYYAIYESQNEIRDITLGIKSCKEALNKITDIKNPDNKENIVSGNMIEQKITKCTSHIIDLRSRLQQKLEDKIIVLQIDLKKINNPYLGDEMLKLLWNRAVEISNAILKDEYEHLEFYSTFDPKNTKLNEIFGLDFETRLENIYNAKEILIRLGAAPSVKIDENVLIKAEKLTRLSKFPQ